MVSSFARRGIGKYVPMLQTILDVVLLSLCFLFYTACFPAMAFGDEIGLPWLLFGASILPDLYWFYATHKRRMMRSEKLFNRAFIGAAIIILVFAALILFVGVRRPRFIFFLLLFFTESMLLSMCWIIELVILKHLRRKGYNSKKVVIVGTSPAAKELSERLLNDEGYGTRVLGYFDHKCPENFPALYLGSIDDLDDFCAQKKVDEIYYTASNEDEKTINKVINIADRHMAQLYLVPLMMPRLKHEFYMIALNGVIPAICVHPTPLHSSFNRFIKRTFDILFSGTVLLFSPIIFIPVAIAIKLSSPGPVFFKQKRTGYLGEDFDCYKFRTMRVNSDSDQVQATKDDNRKTRLGNFLRHTSIDELPQFYNVLRGDMSVVGPRPHMLSHTETYRKLIDQYMVRHLVKPGITGWAQVNGYRGATNELWQMEKRVDNDVWYIEHWSFALDLKIIAATIINALRGEENAY